jgi:hypothetical protein
LAKFAVWEYDADGREIVRRIEAAAVDKRPDQCGSALNGDWSQG